MIHKRQSIASQSRSNTKQAVGAKAQSKMMMNGKMVETANQGTNLRNTSMSNNVINLDLFPLLKGLVPDGYENMPLLNGIYRDIYYYDNVAGAATDLMSFLPFSELTLGGVESKDQRSLTKFSESLDRINIRRLLPELSIDYLVLGTFIGTLIFDRKKGIFTDIIPQDLDHCKITPLPFYSQDPIINVTVAKEVTEVLSGTSKRIQRIKKKLGDDIIKKLQSGSFELDPLTTLYIPRRTLSSREGISYYKRILPIYLLEKNLFKGTLIESAKRQRAILHVIAGSSEWEPTLADLQYLTELFMNADADPIGAIVATRSDVSVSDIRQGGDFWNITSVWADTVPAKLRALGISESFLSGDANFNTTEMALNVFVEQLRAYRDMLTRKIFYDKLFPLISVVNGFYKDPKEAAKWKKKNSDPEDVLYELQDNSSLVIPQIHWHKQLKPEGDNEYIGMLNTLAEAGVPISLRAMAAAGGLSLDQLVNEMDEDYKVRKSIADKKGSLEGGGGGGGEDEEGGGDEEESAIVDRLTTLGHISTDNPYVSAVKRKEIATKGKPCTLLSRAYGDLGEVTSLTKSGKKKYVHNQKAANDKINANISKAAVKLHKEQSAKDDYTARQKRRK